MVLKVILIHDENWPIDILNSTMPNFKPEILYRTVSLVEKNDNKLKALEVPYLNTSQ